MNPKEFDQYINQLVFGDLVHGSIFSCADDADFVRELELQEANADLNPRKLRGKRRRDLAELFRDVSFDELDWLMLTEVARPQPWFSETRTADGKDTMLKVIGACSDLLEKGIVTIVSEDDASELALNFEAENAILETLGYLGINTSECQLMVRNTTYDATTPEPYYGVYLLVVAEGLREVLTGKNA